MGRKIWFFSKSLIKKKLLYEGHGRLARWIKWRTCDVGEAKEGLENELCYDYNYELCSFSKLSIASPTSQLILILQAFHHFTYVTAHSPTLPSLYLRHNSFSNPSIASPTSQLILQPFFRLSYVTGFSLTSPGEPPMPLYRLFLLGILPGFPDYIASKSTSWPH